MGLVQEFKEFAVKGNVVDMAVGVIIGAGFGKIVSSLVADVITPPIGLLVGGVDFSGLDWVLRQAVENADPTLAKQAVVIKYGVFLQTVFDFLIVSSAIFAAVKVINRLKRKHDAPPPPPPQLSGEEKLLTEIRDLLKSGAVAGSACAAGNGAARDQA
ncbi:MAG: large-conductance mechanosensitive channel protein MscL [Polyangiaceae bacterium]|nr:large-conductance mechanosensitive channel protein MscL [Polyangiaceae bacterium]